MDGFEFVAQTPVRRGLRDTPAILVTSRMAWRTGGEESRSALGLLRQGRFDQGQLLEPFER